MTATLNAPPTLAHAHAGGCCSGLSNLQGVITATRDGEEHALAINGGRIVLGPSDEATIFTLALAGPGAVSLSAGESAVAVKDGALIAADGPAAPLRVQPRADGGFTLSVDGSGYLLANGLGAAVSLASEEARATTFQFAPRQRFIAHWAADEGFPNDETHSSHLWIFNRAVEAILGQGALGAGLKFAASFKEADRQVLRAVLKNKVFTDAIAKGIYDADNTGKFDKDTSGFVFSAHFWHPEYDRGGWWDPDPTVNAFQYGARYFEQSLAEIDWARCGRQLGLAIHYLEDLTQPMHTGIYPNVPSLMGTFMAPWSWGFKEKLPNLFEPVSQGPLGPPGFRENSRHENYEQWALHAQSRWAISAADLDALDIGVLRQTSATTRPCCGEYFKTAAGASLRTYRTWVDDERSPVGKLTPGAPGQIPAFADQAWSRDGQNLFKLAQRLVINLLLSWASAAALAEAFRKLPTDTGEDNVLLFGELTVMAARAGNYEDPNRAYLSDPGFEESRWWVLEPVIANGRPMRDNSPLGSDVVVCRIRNRQTAKCLVAGDVYDGHIYHQDPGERLNALWGLVPGEPIVREKWGTLCSSYRFYDLRHRKWLAPSNDRTDRIGPLAHVGDPFAWALIPRNVFVL